MQKPEFPPKGHGRHERGLDDTPHSRLYHGRFGRMFRSLPPAEFTDKLLAKLSEAPKDDTSRETQPPGDTQIPQSKAPKHRTSPETMISEKERNEQNELEVKPEDEIDDEENFSLPAGYTYFGQFIDHDITFDPLSSLVKRNDPDGLTNFRTPALDLDSLYGGGPDDQPYLYEKDGIRFALSDRYLMGALPENEKELVRFAKDLPRFKGRALIGDKRNDENVIVSQLHGLFLRFHNAVADENPKLNFSEIQQLVRWHYQWLVLFDYLPRIVGEEMVEKILPHIKNRTSIYDDQPQLHFYSYRNDPFMPVEFSVAAYRFGHSMVRPVYRLSAFDFTGEKYADLEKIEGLNGRKVLFDPDAKLALNGFHEFEAENGIDWHLFFDTDDHPISPDTLGKGRVQPAYKIDTSLVNPLAFLPEHSKDGTKESKDEKPNTNNLAFRNLKRGVMLGLPSGQSVARLMGLEPIPDKRLLVGKATADGLAPNLANKSEIELRSIIDIDEEFAGKAPLWFYILAEATDEWRKKAEEKNENKEEIYKTPEQKNAVPTLLGPVGGRIVAEVLIGLILGDGDSFLAMEPNWKPRYGKKNEEDIFKKFTMGHLVDFVMKTEKEKQPKAEQ